MEDLFSTLEERLLDIPPTDSWPEMLTLFRKASAKKPHHWRLPAIACDAVGGDANQAILAVLAIACSHISILLVDDMLDADPRGEYHRIGEGAAANLASGFQAVGLAAMARGIVEPEARITALCSLNQMALTTALGQHMDVQNPQDVDAYWEIVRTKSSPFFGVALQVGALVGGASLDTAAQIEQFGCLYGEMVQIHDDLSDAMAAPANADWMLGRASLPTLFAQVVDHPDRERFMALREVIPASDALAEAQAILIRCGAVSYCIDQLLCRVQAAREILASTSFARPATESRLEGLLAGVVEPVKNLFAEIGLEQPETVFQPSEPVA